MMNIESRANRFRNLALAALIGAGIGATVAGSTEALAAPASSAQQLVVGLDGTLLDVMRNAKQLGPQGRYKRLLPIVRQVFDVPFMTETAVGAGWSELSDDQRHLLSDAFAQYMAATYAERFDGYSGEKFVETGERPIGNDMLIATELVKSDGTPIAINYVTRETSGQAQVIDVFLTGTISEMATRRSEFSAIYKRAGYEGLLRTLQQKVAQLQGQSSLS